MSLAQNKQKSQYSNKVQFLQKSIRKYRRQYGPRGLVETPMRALLLKIVGLPKFLKLWFKPNLINTWSAPFMLQVFGKSSKVKFTELKNLVQIYQNKETNQRCLMNLKTNSKDNLPHYIRFKIVTYQHIYFTIVCHSSK